MTDVHNFRYYADKIVADGPDDDLSPSEELFLISLIKNTEKCMEWDVYTLKEVLDQGLRLSQEHFPQSDQYRRLNIAIKHKYEHMSLPELEDFLEALPRNDINYQFIQGIIVETAELDAEYGAMTLTDLFIDTEEHNTAAERDYVHESEWGGSRACVSLDRCIKQKLNDLSDSQLENLLNHDIPGAMYYDDEINEILRDRVNS